MAYSRHKYADADFDTTVHRVRQVLDSEGFVIPAEVNVTDSFRNLLDKDFRSYIILMIGQPSMAYEAMSSDPHIGTLLPANLIIYEQDGGCVVAAMDPALLKQLGDPVTEQLGQAMDTLLEKLFDQITS
ncbi:DUF302 domain-containing protein [Saccharopolyspora sp. ID03-671]|jgi:uncharacterized protein (DUF302 family)|uniref:DUF302 domain-containing protein n=1 Tax=Saccharopolyspora sp. ID03-671 TaxID=3073066 RepID=UPI003243703B